MRILCKRINQKVFRQICACGGLKPDNISRLFTNEINNKGEDIDKEKVDFRIDKNENNINNDELQRSIFRETDAKELLEYNEKNIFGSLKWLAEHDKWKIPLANKKRRKLAKLKRDAERVPLEPMEEQIVVHDPGKPILFPPYESEIFAVVQLAGTQYKITKDDLILAEKLDFDIGDQFEVERILLLGTKDYTVIGRPYLQNAKVILSVEEQTLTEKVIIFKKRRRKGYQKNQGHRQSITVLRVDKIEHLATESAFNTYLPLKI